jgi:hypothetical protein
LKKITVFALIFIMACPVFAENGLTIDGDARTGLNLSKKGDANAQVIVKNSDDSGTPGRFRLNFNYTKDTVQVKWRIQMKGDDQGNNGLFNVQPKDVLSYAYAMGDFFDKQLRVSVGKIGNDNPWETGGDELRTSVEVISGARFEFKPAVIAGLNAGLLIPSLSGPVDAGDYFSELGFALRYENRALDARFAIRLDGAGDDNGGGTAVWRLNAKAIGRVVPGLSIWANGKIDKIATHEGVEAGALTTVSWLYVKYARNKLTGAALRLGLGTWGEGSATNRLTSFYINPVFGYKLTDWAEAALTMRLDMNLSYVDTYKPNGNIPSMFDKLTIEPSVSFTLSGGFIIKPVYAFVFNAANGSTNNTDAARIDHTIELRFQYSF